jgi:hypothetical protein
MLNCVETETGAVLNLALELNLRLYSSCVETNFSCADAAAADSDILND